MANNSAQEPIFTRNFILITCINLFVFFSFQMIFPTLPLYIHHLGGSDAVIGMVMGVFTVTSLITRPLAGWALDTSGRRRIFIAGLIILSITALSYSFATAVGTIIIIRLVHGVGWGISGTSAATVAAEIIPKSRFGEGMGYFSLANSLSMAVAPAAGIYIAFNYGFRNLFWSSSALAVIGIILAFCITYQPLPKKDTALKFSTLYEKSAIVPAFVFFCIAVTFSSISNFLPLYALQRGIDDIGIFFSVYALAILISRPAAGKLVDRYGYDITVIPGMLFVLAAMGAISYVATREMFLAIAFIYGLGFGATQMSLQTMVVRHVPRQRLGAANATFFSGVDSGMGIGAITLGAVASLVGYSKMYLYAGSTVVVALIIYLFYVRKKALLWGKSRNRRIKLKSRFDKAAAQQQIVPIKND